MRRALIEHLRRDLERKIVLLSGPRQAGKTTLSREVVERHQYLNFDSIPDRKVLMTQQWPRDTDLVIFDELHKMKRWKSWLKGIYDTEGATPSLLVTGSARLDVYRKGGDSLAGRHFLYRLHPFTVRELEDQMQPEESLHRILSHGGFPEPFLTNDPNFSRRWRRSHLDTILREDLLDLEKVRDIKSIEIMVDLLRARVGSTTSFSSLAGDLQVSVHTVKHWLQILENLFVIFPVRPYHRNIARSLLKESKYYFFDTGAVVDHVSSPGAVLENAVACALLRELHFHQDTTGRRVALHYLRDKEKREVDFVVVVEQKPTHLIEVKWADDTFSRSLGHFHSFLPSAEAVQVVHELSRARSTREARMTSATKFLSTFSL